MKRYALVHSDVIYRWFNVVGDDFSMVYSEIRRMISEQGFPSCFELLEVSDSTIIDENFNFHRY